jgi:hypothetical protein
MNITSKMIGTELRRIFAALRRPMGWSVIDAFPHLEEREERPSADAKRLEHDDDASQSPRRDDPNWR